MARTLTFPRFLESIQSAFGPECLPLMLPVGQGSAFKGVVDILDLPEEVPGDVIGDVNGSREKLVEAIVSVCDEQLEKYLDGNEIKLETLMGCFSTAIASGSIVPVLCCENKEGMGVESIVDVIAKYTPSPEKGAGCKCSSVNGDKVSEREKRGGCFKKRSFQRAGVQVDNRSFCWQTQFFLEYIQVY